MSFFVSCSSVYRLVLFLRLRLRFFGSLRQRTCQPTLIASCPTLELSLRYACLFSYHTISNCLVTLSAHSFSFIYDSSRLIRDPQYGVYSSVLLLSGLIYWYQSVHEDIYKAVQHRRLLADDDILGFSSWYVFILMYTTLPDCFNIVSAQLAHSHPCLLPPGLPILSLVILQGSLFQVPYVCMYQPSQFIVPYTLSRTLVSAIYEQ